MAQEEEVISAGIVLLPASIQMVPPRDLVQVLEELQLRPAEVAQGLDGSLLVQSLRRQFQLSVGPTRIELKDLHGVQPLIRQGLQHLLVRVATLASATFRAAGANVEFSVGLSQPSGRFVAQELLNVGNVARHLAIDAGDIRGGSARFVFNSDGRRVSVTMEPRLQQIDSLQLYINLNVHRDWDKPESISDEIFGALRGDADRFYELTRAMLATWSQAH